MRKTTKTEKGSKRAPVTDNGIAAQLAHNKAVLKSMRAEITNFLKKARSKQLK